MERSANVVQNYLIVFLLDFLKQVVRWFCLHRIAYWHSNRLLILLLQAETELYIFVTDVIFNMKMKINIDRRGPRLIPNTSQHLDPPHFLVIQLPFTFTYRSTC